jgi:hypothetical protein
MALSSRLKRSANPSRFRPGKSEISRIQSLFLAQEPLGRVPVADRAAGKGLPPRGNARRAIAFCGHFLYGFLD